ncbi:HAD-IIB family hydrolase [Calothrix sp. 336/3]|uniref:HAD-IIB family hydrolase n=1 Tax=Calothrix sp. 336/3 TaxID=1337936 RepID=UPI0004E2EB25|nr:HAD family hydrolase [Calothrix sp. 336/3]AKG22446.1 HAD family hydrolase [Calothrix sp. 336/3]
MMTNYSQIRLVATDMDGTLTTQGKFTSKLLQSLVDLATAGITVVIVTGRSGGWVNGIASYLPVAGAIAENGGIFYLGGSDRPIPLTPIDNITHHRQQLAAVFAELQGKFPQIQESHDNRFRITDWTFDVTGFTTQELQTMANMCQQLGWGFTYSTVQCHIKPQQQDKAIGLSQVLREYFPQYSPQEIVTVGDSPNDESLFNRSYFPFSVGVANVREYLDKLQHHPTHITANSEGEGFCELAKLILGKGNREE